MTKPQRKRTRIVTAVASSTLRWITGFDPFGPYTAAAR
jgi:hypothetical protein